LRLQRGDRQRTDCRRADDGNGRNVPKGCGGEDSLDLSSIDLDQLLDAKRTQIAD